MMQIFSINTMKCNKCALGKKNTCFFGFGDKNSDIFIILRSPDSYNQPISTTTKNILNKLLSLSNLSNISIYYSFAIKSHIPLDKTISKTFLKICSFNLIDEIQKVQPKVIIALGKEASYLFGKKFIVNTIFYDKNFNSYVIITHNPLILTQTKNQKLKQEIVQAFKIASEILTGNYKIVEAISSPNVKIIDNVEEINKIDNILSDIIAIDLETTGLNFLVDDILSIGISDKNNNYGIIYSSDLNDAIYNLLKKRKLIFQNGKFDLKFLKKVKIDVIQNYYFDTKLAYYVISGCHSSSSLESLALKFLHTKLTKGTIDFDKVNLENLNEYAIYATNDAYMTYLLYEIFSEKIKNNKDYNKLFNTIIIPTAKWLTDAEYYGILIDKKYVTQKIEEMKKLLIDIENRLKNNKKIIEFCKINNIEEFNIRSPLQLKKLLNYLYDKNISNVSKQTIEQLQSRIKDDLLLDILTYKQIYKGFSTYFENLIKYSKYDNYIHTEYLQTNTATGRLSSKNPNLQNITKRGVYAKELRQAFIAREGYSLIQADYKSAELRVLAHYSRDDKLIQMLNEDQDIHRFIASLAYKKSQEEITDDERSIAKTVVFGLIYGRGIKSVANQFNLTLEEAQDIKDIIFNTFNKAVIWIEQVQKFVTKYGYVKNLFGRKILIPDIYSVNKEEYHHALRCSVNYPIQSTAADLTNLAGALLFEKFKKLNLDAKILLNIHDALVIETKDNLIKDIIELIKTTMIIDVQKISKLRVKLSVDVVYGKTLNFE